MSSSTTNDKMIYGALPADKASMIASIGSSERTFGIRAADNDGSRSKASMLINKMYSWRGYGSGFRVDRSPDHITLIANDYHDGTAIGTLTVGLDQGHGLLVDSVYRDEANGLRAQGRKLCEMTKFAVEHHVNSKQVLAALFHVAFIYAYHLHARTDLLIEVNPSHVSFYRRLLCFEAVGPEKTNPRVGAPSLLLRLDLALAADLIRKFGGTGKSVTERSLYPYAFSDREEAGILARLRQLETGAPYQDMPVDTELNAG